MNIRHAATNGRQETVEALADRLTTTAYSVMLKHQERTCWLDLELELWRALHESLKSAQERTAEVA